MDITTFPNNDILDTARSFVFLGETGSGKTEFALNLAVALAGLGRFPVHLFDLDQTKPLFRSRDACSRMEAQGVTLHFDEQLLDAPTLAPGVRSSIQDDTRYTLLDVGGGEMGSRMVGGLAPLLNRGGAAAFYIVNPYRPWSKNTGSIEQTMAAVLGASRIQNMQVWANPTLGAGTTAAEFLTGLEQAQDMLPADMPVSGVCVLDTLLPEVQGKVSLSLYPIQRYLGEPWE